MVDIPTEDYAGHHAASTTDRRLDAIESDYRLIAEPLRRVGHALSTKHLDAYLNEKAWLIQSEAR